MEAHDSTPIPPSPPAGAAPSAAIPPVSGAASRGSGKSGTVRLWALGGAGVAAALASWLLIEATLGTFKATTSARRFGRSTYMIAGSQERHIAETRNAALALGLTGATVGLGLGWAGGLARRLGRAALSAALLGLVLGSAAGAGAAFAVLPVASRVYERDPGDLSTEMISSLLAHGGTWGAIGAVGGLAFGIGVGGRGRAIRGLVGGLVGAVFGAILYELIGELALPGTKLVDAVAATWSVRLLAQVLAVIPAVACVAVLGPEPPPQPYEPAVDLD